MNMMIQRNRSQRHGFIPSAIYSAQGIAKYFWEAIKIRYPDYCYYVDWEAVFYVEN